MSERALVNILYVEDDPNMRMLVELTLIEGGFNVEVCERWSEALTIAEIFKPDLLLLDVVLPEKDGVDTLLALRDVEGLGEVPVIFLTVDVQLEYPKNQDAASLGPYGMLGKPIQVETLCDLLREAWKKLVSEPVESE